MRTLTVDDLRPGAIQDLYPRLLGVLGLIWTPIFQKGALTWASDLLWMACTLGWLAVSALLVAGRRTQHAALALAALSMVMMLDAGSHIHEPLTLLWWLGLAVFFTEGRPTERALLVRVTVTVAYAFAFLSKLNPSFLGGEQLVALSIERSQINWLTETFRTNVGIVIAWLAVATEGAMAVALWFRRTRVVAAVVGASMHVVFIFVAHNSTVWDIAFVTVLNMALVVSYLAFFVPIESLLSRGTDQHAADEPATGLSAD